jgi:hypothetical protein
VRISSRVRSFVQLEPGKWGCAAGGIYYLLDKAGVFDLSSESKSAEIFIF